MIQANPELPRLTRGEILDLLENITKSDFMEAQQQSKDSDRNPKAIMVVQAYTPETVDDNNMKDLFTKPPVTHIVAAQPDKKLEGNLENDTINEDQYNSNQNEIHKSTFEKPKKSKANHIRSRPTTTVSTTSTSTSTTTTSSYPSTVASNETPRPIHHRRRRPQIKSSPVTRDPPVTTYAPKYRRPISRRPTTTEKHPNHRYPEDGPEEPTTSITYSNQGIKVISPPKLIPSEQDNKEAEPAPIFRRKLSTTTVASPTETANNLPDLGIEVPEHLRSLLSQMILSNSEQENPSVPVADSPATNTDDAQIQNMVAVFRNPSFSAASTTTTAMPDVSNVAENLTPEMRDLLMSFGLIPNDHHEQSTTSQIPEFFAPVKAEVKPESYVGFKPLPEDAPTREEMEDFLAKFGLGRSGRNAKSVRKNKEDGSSVLDVVPEDYKSILENIGIPTRQGKKLRSESLVLEKQQHVFSPDDSKNATQEDIEKLNKLLNVVKQLEQLNRTATDEDLKKIDTDSLKEILQSFNEEDKRNHIIPLEEQAAPNPIYFELGADKNDVKRQEESPKNETKSDDTKNNETKQETTTIESTTKTPSTSAAEPIVPNIKDLEDSFGGQTDPPTEPPVVETTTPLRRTGFYMLVDWNSFLDIDDQKGKRVNLRFQPKIGDPKRFYSVSVP